MNIVDPSCLGLVSVLVVDMTQSARRERARARERESERARERESERERERERESATVERYQTIRGCIHMLAKIKRSVSHRRHRAILRRSASTQSRPCSHSTSVHCQLLPGTARCATLRWPSDLRSVGEHTIRSVFLDRHASAEHLTTEQRSTNPSQQQSPCRLQRPEEEHHFATSSYNDPPANCSTDPSRQAPALHCTPADAKRERKQALSLRYHYCI